MKKQLLLFNLMVLGVLLPTITLGQSPNLGTTQDFGLNRQKGVSLPL